MTRKTPNRPPLSEQDKQLVRRLFRSGRTIAGLSREFGVNHMSIRRIVDPETYPMPQSDYEAQKQRRQHLHACEAREKVDASQAVVISDYPDTLTGWLCGDPTPQRRQLLREGRI